MVIDARTQASVLRRAAVHVRSGWRQRSWGPRVGGRVCAQGALARAAQEHQLDPEDVASVYALVGDRVGGPVRGRIDRRIPGWNDRRGQTAERVAGVLDGCAAELETSARRALPAGAGVRGELGIGSAVLLEARLLEARWQRGDVPVVARGVTSGRSDTRFLLGPGVVPAGDRWGSDVELVVPRGLPVGESS